MFFRSNGFSYQTHVCELLAFCFHLRTFHVIFSVGCYHVVLSLVFHKIMSLDIFYFLVITLFDQTYFYYVVLFHLKVDLLGNCVLVLITCMLGWAVTTD